MQCEPKWINKKAITPSPISHDIYGKVRYDDEFLASIFEHGILEPLIIDQHFNLLSGHRRLYVALLLDNIVEVPCVIREVQSKEEAVVIIIDANRQRKKTPSMIESEAWFLNDAVAKLSAKKQVDAPQKARKKAVKELTLLHKCNNDDEQAATPESNDEPKASWENTTRAIVASTVGSSATFIDQVRELKLKRPDLLEKADAGDKKVGSAYAQMKREEAPNKPVKPKKHGGKCRVCRKELACC